MPHSFSISVDIEAPPARVWAVMSDVERWHEWTSSISSVRMVDPGPLALGARADIRQPRVPPARWRVTALDPGRTFTWTTGSVIARSTAHHSVEAVGGGSRATLAVHYTGVLGWLVARLARRLTEDYLALEAAGLKRRSEAAPA